MKKTAYLTVAALVLFAIGITASYAQPMGPGMMGPGYGNQQQEGWNYCPYCGRYMGPRTGYGMGPGRMHGGYGGWGMGPQYGPQYGPGYQGPQFQQPQKPIDGEEAKNLLENYLASTRNTKLKLGTIEDKGNAFEAEIQTKDGSLVDKILVDKRTGWLRSIY
jgi:hypothetical protein